MTGKRIAYTLVILAGIGAALAIGVLIGKTTPDAVERGAFTPATTTNAIEVGSTIVTATTTQETCAQKEKDLAGSNNTEYEPGTLLVSFKPSITFKQARSLIDSRGLRINGSSTSDDFNSNHWLTIDVAKGEEFDWICTLRADEEVKTVTLNPLFNLAE